MKKKTLRIKLEYQLTLEEFNDITAARRLDIQRRSDDYSETVTGNSAWENIHRQKRLQLALFDHPELAEEYMLHAATEQFGLECCDGLNDLIPNPNSQQILEKAIQLLDEKDQVFYEKVLAEESLVEHIEVICDTTKGQITSLEFEWREESVVPVVPEKISGAGGSRF